MLNDGRERSWGWWDRMRPVTSRADAERAGSYGVSGNNFILLVIMILILLFVLMSIGPLFAVGAVL